MVDKRRSILIRGMNEFYSLSNFDLYVSPFLSMASSMYTPLFKFEMSKNEPPSNCFTFEPEIDLIVREDTSNSVWIKSMLGLG